MSKLMAPDQIDRESRSAGRAAGLIWAAGEARRGYRHPLTLEPRQQLHFLVDHAREAFGGLIRGRRHAFIRGFVEGVAEFRCSQRVSVN